MFTFGHLTLLPQILLLLAAWYMHSDMCVVFVVAAAALAMVIYRKENLFCAVYASIDTESVSAIENTSKDQLRFACSVIESMYVEQVDKHWFKSLMPVFVAAVLHYVAYYAIPASVPYFLWIVGLSALCWAAYTSFQMFAVTHVGVFEAEFIPESFKPSFHKVPKSA
jgi:type IV secretory pathway TrbD component